jgi:hypothetical protein
MTSQNRGHHWPIVHPPGEYEWRAVVMMIPADDNSWLVYNSSLAVLLTETSLASRRNGRRNENFAYLVPVVRQRIFTCRKILWHGTSSFASHPKEGVLWIFISHKNPSHRSCLIRDPLGPVASTLTTTPPRRLTHPCSYCISGLGSWCWRVVNWRHTPVKHFRSSTDYISFHAASWSQTHY